VLCVSNCVAECEQDGAYYDIDEDDEPKVQIQVKVRVVGRATGWH
jgi:hypothetical protein